MSIDQDDVAPQYLVTDLKADRGFRQMLPILVVLFTPITISCDAWYAPAISLFFFFGRIDLRPLPIPYSLGLSFVYPYAFLILSIPALVVGIISAWELRRLSKKKTTARDALLAIVGVTVIWTVYLSIMFFGSLSIGRLVIGPFPVPFGPLVAVLSRDYITSVTEQIDELEKSA